MGKQVLLGKSGLRFIAYVVLQGMALGILVGCGYGASNGTIQGPISLQGTVRGGQEPVIGASVQLYAAGVTGTGSAAQPLLDNPVRTDSNGTFQIAGSYRCPSASSQIYVVARGGNPGLSSGVDNPALALTSMLGSCGNLSASTAIYINEATTVGSIWPLAPYMSSPENLGSALNDTSFLGAISTVSQFVNIGQGSSPGISTPTSYFAQSSKLYSLANAFDKCVNSPGGLAGDSSPCGVLFSLATLPGSNPPTDTITAAMHIAQNPSRNVTDIFGLTTAPTPYQPELNAAPGDWTLALSQPVATPVISLATGTYVGAQQVTISDSTAQSTIYYTTDGSTPSSSSTLYGGAISIGVSTTVQAIAVIGISQSAVASSTLTITAAPTPPAPTPPAPTPPAPTPAKLAFRQQPTDSLAQAPISPAIQVAVEDASGVAVPSATNLVTLTLTNSGGLGGTIQVAAQNGVATFSNLTVSTAGAYTLSATSPGLASSTSTGFTVTLPGTAPIPATLFGLTITHIEDASPTIPYGTTRSWDNNPDLAWTMANPSSGVYDFTALDTFITYFQSKGAEMIYTFGRTPQWASSQPNAAGPYGPGQCAPPSDLSVWDSYVTAIATHAAGKIKYWELWNEPQDLQYYCGDIPTMVTMAQHASQIIKAIDPSALILSPAATGPPGPNWLSTFLADGGASAVDIVAFHGYWSATAEDIVTVIGNYKAVMQANGVTGKPMWDTEASWAGFGNLPTPALAQQEGFISRYYLLQNSEGVSRFVWYAYDGLIWGGLETSAGGPSSAAIAYQVTYGWMVGASLAQPCSANASSIWTCVFTRPGGYQAEAVWIPSSTATLAVPPLYTEYRDLAGTLHQVVNGTVTIGDEPILLESSDPPS